MPQDPIPNVDAALGQQVEDPLGVPLGESGAGPIHPPGRVVAGGVDQHEPRFVIGVRSHLGVVG